jgi:hypothetical protein
MSKQLEAESEIRDLFNSSYKVAARKTKLRVGQTEKAHEFDIYDANRIIGGITTSPWKNLSGSSNSGGQDRASAELLWLTLWQGDERRVIILSNEDMANRLLRRFRGSNFPHHIEIIHYDSSLREFKELGRL